MLKDAAIGHPHGAKPLPVTPTLVIGLGKFGRHVGVQLAARLTLTEDGLRYDGGLTHPLLVKMGAHNRPTPGFVRIMELGWDQWFSSSFAPDTFLKDIETKPGEAEQRTPPQFREDNRHSEDYADARAALRQQPELLEQILTATEPLCVHDMPHHMGPYDSPDKDNKLGIRIFVVFAAREPASAALIPEFIELLGEKYVHKKNLVKGVRLLCYIGFTPRTEHLEAGGSNIEFDQFLSAELDRICPPTGLLQTLEEKCQDPKDPLVQTLETCYLLDGDLASRQRAVQLRLDEPDEVVVAAALALTMFIATDGDNCVRNAISHRWYPKHSYDQPGLFTSFGIASYAIDHPKLRRLVYSQVVGTFLLLAQPITAGEKQLAQGNPDDEEIADDAQLDAQINRDVQKQIVEYSKRIAFKVVERRMPKSNGAAGKKINFKQAIDKLQRCNPLDRQDVRDMLDDITADLADDMRSMALTYRIQQRQQDYTNILKDEAETRLQDQYDSVRAPLARIYRFLSRSLEVLKAEARKYNASFTRQGSKQGRNSFVQDQTDDYERTVGEKVTSLQTALSRPSRWIGAFGRASLAAPIVLLALQLLSGFWQTISGLPLAILSGIGISSDSVNSTLSSIQNLPIIIYLLLITLITWVTIYWIYRRIHYSNIRKALSQLMEKHGSILQKADEEAWRDALTETFVRMEQLFTDRVKPLCMPHGIISRLREQSLADQYIKQDRVLERVFFDEDLKRELKEFSKQLANDGLLWNQRKRLLQDLVETQPIDQDKIGAWLRDQAEILYQSKVTSVTDLINKFLENQTTQRLEEMWRNLSRAAVPLLRHDAYAQDDPSVELGLFGVHGKQEVDELRRLAKRSNVKVLDSADRLRWIFMHTHTGLHLEGMTFSAELFKPKSP